MSPYQRGEVFVTEDGAETDLDLGHYERFTDVALRKENNVTTGQIYNGAGKGAPRRLPRRDDQVIPHVTNEIKRRIQGASAADPDVVIVEVGGTVGDIEGLPASSRPSANCARTWKPQPHELRARHPATFLSGSNELKTKPTQHSVRELRSIGINPT